MKKNYMKPNLSVFILKTEALLGINSINEGPAAAGSSGNTVNYSRGGSDWDDED